MEILGCATDASGGPSETPPRPTLREELHAVRKQLQRRE
jgi:hypothetical protein